MTDELNQDDQLSAAEREAKQCEALSEAEQVEYSNARAVGLSHAEAIELVKDTSDEPAAAFAALTDLDIGYVPEPEAPAVVEDTPIDTPIANGVNDHVAYDAPKREEN